MEKKAALPLCHLQIKVSTPSENEEIVTWYMLEAGAEGVAVDDPAIIRRHLCSKSWDASVFDDMDIQVGRITLSCIMENDEQGNSAAEELRQKVLALADTCFELSLLPEEDWQNTWKEGFAARPIGSGFWLTPLWLAGEPCPKERKKLVVEPGMAFGTGDHATTAMALELLEQHMAKGSSLLDLGCGSGILAIGGALLGAEDITAVDIDEVCLPAVEKHCLINDIPSEKISCFIGDILTDEELRQRIFSRRYGTVTANINAAIVRQLIPIVPQLLEKGGIFIASGVVDIYEQETAQAFAMSELELIEVKKEKDWLAYCAVKKEQEDK